MPGHRYRARERTVKKMSRDGLLEESLGSGKRKRVSKKTVADISEKTEPNPTEDVRNRDSKEADPARRKLYMEPEETDMVSSGQNKWRQRKQMIRETPEKSTHEKKGILESMDQDTGETTRRIRKIPPQETDEEATAEEQDAAGKDISAHQHSARLDSMREHSSKLSDASVLGKEELLHNRKKRQVQKYAAEKKKQRVSENDTVHEPETLADAKEEIAEKRKKERLNQEQRKQRPLLQEGRKNKDRLSFDDETGMAQGGRGVPGRKLLEGTGQAVAGTALLLAHAKTAEAEEDNAGVEASHHAERFLEDQFHKTSGKRQRTRNGRNARGRHEQTEIPKLRFGEEALRPAAASKAEAEKKTVIRKFYQKQRYRRMYANAKKQEKTAEQVIQASQNLTAKAAAIVQEAIRRNSKLLIGAGIMGVFFLLISSSLTSCTALIHGTGSSVVSTTYASTDEEIYKVENAYEEMERALNDQINGIGNRYPGYESFRYQIDEISHNPYHLISYFTAKYGEFTYDQVKDELEEIFRQQYGITASGETGVTLTETKTVRVGESLGKVVTSGYCNCALCCGQWAGGPTASGVYPTASHTIAVDASNPFVPIGTHVVMNGVEYVVEDTGAFARYGVQFDVYYGDHASAQAHGHQSWDAYLADSNGSREIQVTTTESVNRLSVTMTNHNLDSVLRERMNRDEEKHYDIYNQTFGNRDYLFDLDKIPSYSIEGGYRIPPEALSDVRFANMIREAEKYLGYPYEWGGSSPSTSFDCSGFVSWVVNHCGNGWNVGRQTAEGLRSNCAYVSAADARPGDLIFFQGTYNTPGASHVGIYVGNGMMIHCGNPIQYTSINTSYWQSHFYQFGRLP